MTTIGLALLLPDGRRVGVTCNDHFGRGLSLKLNRCKMPIGDEIEARFSGKEAKLRWAEGIDGKKKDSETYTITAMAPARQPQSPSPGSSSQPSPEPGR